jgi:deaminated glutathione amidase
VQNCAGDDISSNLEKIGALVLKASREHADLICLPEFYSLIERSDVSYLEKACSVFEHPAFLNAQELVGVCGCWLLLGSIPVKAPNGKIFNKSILMRPDGTVEESYNKIHLFDVAIKDGQAYRESNSVQPGTEAVVAETPWGKLGLTICYDLRFPNLYHALAKNGADFISVPAAFTAKTGAAHWHTLLKARAIETGCYLFAPAQCGERQWGRRTYGHSLIIDPWGKVLADGGDSEGFIIADIDPSMVASVRQMIPAINSSQPFHIKEG